MINSPVVLKLHPDSVLQSLEFVLRWDVGLGLLGLLVAVGFRPVQSWRSTLPQLNNNSTNGLQMWLRSAPLRSPNKFFVESTDAAALGVLRRRLQSMLDLQGLFACG